MNKVVEEPHSCIVAEAPTSTVYVWSTLGAVSEFICISRELYVLVSITKFPKAAMDGSHRRFS